MLRRMVKIGVVVGLLALTVGGLSVAQQGGGRPWGGGRRNFDPDQTEQMMMIWIKMQLGVMDDAEWKVIEPRLQKVVELTQQMLMGRVRGMLDVTGFGRGGLGGGNDDGNALLARGSGPHGEMTALDKAMAQLGATARIRLLRRTRSPRRWPPCARRG